MNYSVATITADVRACLDEIGVNEAEFLQGSDSANMDAIIESKIPDAIRFINLNAPLEMLDPKNQTGSGSSNESGMVSLALPSDYLRLCYAFIDEWKFPVSSIILYTDKQYAALKNHITTGHPDTPKVAISVNASGRMLELYSSSKKRGTVPISYGYIAEPTKSGSYSINERIYRAIVYHAAGLTLLTFKDTHADSLFNMANSIIESAKTNNVK